MAALLRERGIGASGSAAGTASRRGAPQQGIPYHAIATGKLRRYWAWRNVTDLAVNVPAGFVGAPPLRRLRPRVVLATGGFVALPVVMAAALARVPVVVHEQTAVPGLANRVAARFARRIAVTFAGAARHFPAARVVVPATRCARSCAPGPAADAVARFGLDPTLPLVYVTGGALGAHAVNRAVGEVSGGCSTTRRSSTSAATTRPPATARGCRPGAPPCRRRWPGATRCSLGGAELAGIYAAVALVVARAGAGTVNECCQLGLPALYIPLPGASGDEQTANARLVERAGGCAILPQASLTPALLLERILGLLAEPARLKEMGERARALAIPDAADRLVDLLLEVPREPAARGRGGAAQPSQRGSPRQCALATATSSAWNSLKSAGSEGRCASRNARVAS